MFHFFEVHRIIPACELEAEFSKELVGAINRNGAVHTDGHFKSVAVMRPFPKGVHKLDGGTPAAMFRVYPEQNGLRYRLISTVVLQGEKACDYGVQFAVGDSVNAYADGKNIVVFRGLMRVARNDTELALVIGHELAHNAMGHLDKKKQNAGLGSFIDILAAMRGVNTQGMFGKMGAGAYSQDFEAEADYVGLYMLAATGVDISEAPQFWRRMAAETGYEDVETIISSADLLANDTLAGFTGLDLTVTGVSNFTHGTGYLTEKHFLARNEFQWEVAA